MSLSKPHSPYTVTSSKVLYWFHRVNKSIFRSEIPKPRNIILTERGVSMWGGCYSSTAKDSPRWWDLQLIRYFPTFTSFIECLIHEMVHAHCYWYATEEYITPGHRGHGKTFFSWKKPLTSFGIHLSARMLAPEMSKSNMDVFSRKIKVP